MPRSIRNQSRYNPTGMLDLRSMKAPSDCGSSGGAYICGDQTQPGSGAGGNEPQWFGGLIPPVAMSMVILPEILTSVLPILNVPSLPAGSASSGSGCGAGLAMR